MWFGTFEAPGIGSRLFEELTAVEAKAVARRAEEGIARRLPSISADIGDPDPGRPVESIRASWQWLLDRLPVPAPEPPPPPPPSNRQRRRWWSRSASPPQPSRAATSGQVTRPDVPETEQSWTDIGADDIPYWCWFRDGSGTFRPLGPEACVDIDAVGAYVATLLLRYHTDARVVVSSARSTDVTFRKPAIALSDGREYNLPLAHVKFAAWALDPTERLHAEARDPAVYAEKYRRWFEPLPPLVAGPPDPRFTVESSTASNRGSATERLVLVDEETCHLRSDEVDLLVEALAGVEEISSIDRSDRELIVIDAPELDDAGVLELVLGAWAEIEDGETPGSTGWEPRSV